ncbi:hypothetical protein AD945_03785 [Gluconobacter albidus]|uniref:Bacterial virulence protein VirB8 domain-containing protein n=2 Tax=Gluconobacter albidus TaxID=318683 RepID=A0A149TLK1_9PROT|nr:hypothetical protein AD945_03785 [Gluconobacter albidus]
MRLTMLDKIFKRVSRAGAVASPVQLPPDGGVLDEPTHDRVAVLSGKRSQREVAQLQSELNFWRLMAGGLVVGIIVTSMGWRRADDRYANDVRIAWVKVAPDGRSEAQLWSDGGNPNRFFEPFINSALINFVEHRFRHIRTTIVSDYGLAAMFMSPQLQREFLDNEHAAQEATDFEASGNGGEYTIIVKAIDHSTMVDPDAANRNSVIVDSTVYVTQHWLDGSRKDEQKIVKLTWKMIPLANLQRDWKQLQENGPGVQILAYHMVTALNQEH